MVRADRESMSCGALAARVFSADTDWEELEPLWRQVADRVAVPFFYQQPEWFSAYSQVYPTTPAIRFAVLFRGEKPVAVFPLACRRRGGIASIKEVTVPVTRQLYMPDSVIDSSEEPATLFKFLLDQLKPLTGDQWDVFAIRNTLGNSTISQAVATLESYSTKTRNTDPCTVISVLPYEEALGRMQAGFRQNLTRRKRQLSKLDSVEYSVTSDVKDIRNAFDDFVELEQAGWKGGHGPMRGKGGKPLAIALNADKRRFYELAINNLAVRNKVEIFSLRVGSRLIASRIWICVGNWCYALKTSYDETYRRYSPGTLMFDFAYQHQAAKGSIRSINLIYEQPALAGWGTTTLQYQTHLCFNHTIRGRVLSTWRNYSRQDRSD